MIFESIRFNPLTRGQGQCHANSQILRVPGTAAEQPSTFTHFRSEHGEDVVRCREDFAPALVRPAPTVVPPARTPECTRPRRSIVYTYRGIPDGFDLQILVVNPANNCNPVAPPLAPTSTSSCVLSDPLIIGPGTFYLWAGSLFFTGVPCGSKYTLYITDETGAIAPVCGVTPTTGHTWGSLKTLYR